MSSPRFVDEYAGFLAFAPVKTQALNVSVTDENNKVLRSYYAPAGFHLDRWCLGLFNVKIIESQFDEGDFVIKCFDKNKELIEIHTARYIQKKSGS